MTKPSTFEQIMKQSDVVDKRASALYKARGKYNALISNFPECRNKLFEYEGKKYLVTNQPKEILLQDRFKIVEIQED